MIRSFYPLARARNRCSPMCKTALAFTIHRPETACHPLTRRGPSCAMDCGLIVKTRPRSNNPAPAGYVGDRILFADDELATREVLVEHRVMALRLAAIAIDRIGQLFRGGALAWRRFVDQQFADPVTIDLWRRSSSDANPTGVCIKGLLSDRSSDARCGVPDHMQGLREDQPTRGLLRGGARTSNLVPTRWDVQPRFYPLAREA